MELYDCIIVGGGPAGLNAAVVLGRCQRKVLIFDTQQYRNRFTHAMHNFLTRDHIDPAKFIELSRKEIDKYGVEIKYEKVVNARKIDEVFIVHSDNNLVYHSKKLLIATGLKDLLPTLPGFEEMYGKSVFHCPYCDAWEVKDKTIAVYAKNKNGFELAVNLKAWTENVLLFTDGVHKLKAEEKEELDANDIPVVYDKVERLEGKKGILEKVVMKNGEEHLCQALFFVNGYEQQCNLMETFDCEMSKRGKVVTNQYQQTNTPGLYVAGDADKDMHFVVIAAAEGAKAAVTINKELQKEISLKRVEKMKGQLV